MDKKINGNITIDEREYFFELEGTYLNLYKDSTNKESINWDNLKSLFPAGGKWISAFNKYSKYYFHCSNPIGYTQSDISLYVDYYAVGYSIATVENFGQLKTDGFVFSEDFIGEFIKDKINVNDDDKNDILTISFPKQTVEINCNNLKIQFTHTITGNPECYGLSSIKPILIVKKTSSTIDELINIYENVNKTFSFLFRKNAIYVESIQVILQNDDNFQIFFTNYKSNEIENNHLISTLVIPYLGNIYELVSTGQLNCYHIPANRKFEITHLILMYSWFEKLYKTLPTNPSVEIVTHNNGHKQLHWKNEDINKKRKAKVSIKEQLDLVLQDNPKLNEYALEILMRYSGWFHIGEFLSGFSKRVSNFRNDIIHNDGILWWYNFIIQDTRFLELINYYLIMKYKCNCPEDELEKIIDSWFFKI